MNQGKSLFESEMEYLVTNFSRKVASLAKHRLKIDEFEAFCQDRNLTPMISAHGDGSVTTMLSTERADGHLPVLDMLRDEGFEVAAPEIVSRDATGAVCHVKYRVRKGSIDIAIYGYEERVSS